MLLALHNHNNRRVEINSYRINPIRREVDYQLFPLSSMHLSGRDPDERDQYPEDVQHKRRGDNGFPLVLDYNSTTFIEVCASARQPIQETLLYLRL